MIAGPLPTSPLGSMEMGGKDMLQRWRQSLPSMPLPPTIQVDTTMIRSLPHHHFHHNYHIHDIQESPSSSSSSKLQYSGISHLPDVTVHLSRKAWRRLAGEAAFFCYFPGMIIIIIVLMIMMIMMIMVL